MNAKQIRQMLKNAHGIAKNVYCSHDGETAVRIYDARTRNGKTFVKTICAFSAEQIEVTPRHTFFLN